MCPLISRDKQQWRDFCCRKSLHDKTHDSSYHTSLQRNPRPNPGCAYCGPAPRPPLLVSEGLRMSVHATSAASSLALFRNWPSYQYRAARFLLPTVTVADHAVRPPLRSDTILNTGAGNLLFRHSAASSSCHVLCVFVAILSRRPFRVARRHWTCVSWASGRLYLLVFGFNGLSCRLREVVGEVL